MNEYEKYRNQKEKKITITLICWSTASILLMILALVAALFPPSLPNSFLLLYGFSAVAAWQMLHYLEHYLTKSGQEPSGKKHRIIGQCLLIGGIVFFYIGTISAVATYSLFPHPNILERFTKVIVLNLPGFIFGPAVLVGFFLLRTGYFLLQGRWSSRMLVLAQNQKIREKFLSQRLQDISKQKNGKKAKGDEKYYKISWMKYIHKRFFSVWSFLLLLSGWIFIGIPFKTYPEMNVAPKGYTIGALITIAGVILFLVQLLRTSYVRYSFDGQNLTGYRIFKPKNISRQLITEIFFLDGLLIIEDLHNNHCRIYLREMQDAASFFEYLLDYLPLKNILISENGWKYLKKSFSEEKFNKFSKAYKFEWTNAEEKQTESKKKKRKK